MMTHCSHSDVLTISKVYSLCLWFLSISFHFRCGTIFNMARLILDDYNGGYDNGFWWQRLFNGYSITTWLVVLNLGSTGLLVSWLMKYADNIVKVNFLFMASSSYYLSEPSSSTHANNKISISAMFSLMQVSSKLY